MIPATSAKPAISAITATIIRCLGRTGFPIITTATGIVAKERSAFRLGVGVPISSRRIIAAPGCATARSGYTATRFGGPGDVVTDQPLPALVGQPPGSVAIPGFSGW
jgi:hypothetical protein